MNEVLKELLLLGIQRALVQVWIGSITRRKAVIQIGLPRRKLF
jgi:hypothetical protein